MLRTRWKSILVTVLAVAYLHLLAGCGLLDSDDDSDDVAGPDDSEEFESPFEGTVFFAVAEGYSTPGAVEEPAVYLRMVTEKYYPCYNWEIDATMGYSSDTLSVELLGIYVPEICLTAFGPATRRLGPVLENGGYHLAFRCSTWTDLYRLAITDSSIEVEGAAGNLTSPQILLAWRYPPLSFAYLCETTQGTSWIYTDFLDSLHTIETLHEFDFPDTGYIPYAASGAGVWNNSPTVYFRYSDEANFARAGALLASYSRDVVSQHPGVRIRLVNWRNENFRSWLYGLKADRTEAESAGGNP